MFLVARAVVPRMLAAGSGRIVNTSIMPAPIVWLASSAAADVHNERIIANEFDEWLARRSASGHSRRGDD